MSSSNTTPSSVQDQPASLRGDLTAISTRDTLILVAAICAAIWVLIGMTLYGTR